MPVPPNPKFLVVDDNGDSRFLLVKTLLRKFPAAVVQECQHADAAIEMARTEKLAAIVAHRAIEMDGITLIRMLRRVNTETPVVMVSGYDRNRESILAGATAFLNYDEWLRIGTLVGELLAAKSGEAGTGSASPIPSGAGPTSGTGIEPPPTAR